VEEKMEQVPVNEPATLIAGGIEVGFESRTAAIKHAVEEAEETDRARMVITTKSGEKFH
jgi:hypothetical protein